MNNIVSFVIPLYNAQASVRQLTTRILKLPFRSKREIILINDGSVDTTDPIVRNLAAKHKSIRYIQLAGNFGQHNAILTGLHYARGDVVICLDDDLQTPPEESIVLLKAMVTQHANVVYGQYETNEDALRRIGTRLHNLMAQLFGKPKGVTLTSFFCMTQSIARAVSQYRGSYVYLPGLVLRATRKIASVPVAHESRRFGRSGYTVGSLMKLWMIGVLVYLRLADLFRSKPAAVVKAIINLP